MHSDSGVKLCKDCRHCIPTKWLWFKCWEDSISMPPLCRRTVTRHTSPVDGHTWMSEPGRCDSERFDGACEIHGKYWEAKECTSTK